MDAIYSTFTIDVYADDEILMERYEMEIESLDEPRFFAVVSEEPMASVNIRSYTWGTPSFFQIDHLQYGVPEPSAFFTCDCSFPRNCFICAALAAMISHTKELPARGERRESDNRIAEEANCGAAFGHVAMIHLMVKTLC